MYIASGPVCTYQTSHISRIIAQVPLDNLLLFWFIFFTDPRSAVSTPFLRRLIYNTGQAFAGVIRSQGHQRGCHIIQSYLTAQTTSPLLLIHVAASKQQITCWYTSCYTSCCVCRSSSLSAVNAMLREQLEQAGLANEALSQDLRRLTADWTKAREELEQRESDWRREEEVGGSFCCCWKLGFLLKKRWNEDNISSKFCLSLYISPAPPLSFSLSTVTLAVSIVVCWPYGDKWLGSGGTFAKSRAPLKGEDLWPSIITKLCKWFCCIVEHHLSVEKSTQDHL